MLFCCAARNSSTPKTGSSGVRVRRRRRPKCIASMCRIAATGSRFGPRQNASNSRGRARFQRRSAWALAAVGALVAVGIAAGALQSRETAKREAIVLTSLADRAAKEGFHDRAMRIALHGLPTRDFLPWVNPWSQELEAKLAGGALRAGSGLSSLAKAAISRALTLARTAAVSSPALVMGRHGSGMPNSAPSSSCSNAAMLRFGVSFSPDGARIVTLGSSVESPENTARLWDARTGGKVAELDAHKDAIWSAVFSPDGRRVLTSSQDQTAWLWNAEDGAKIAVLDEIRAPLSSSASFSSDGSRIVTRSDDMASLSPLGWPIGSRDRHLGKRHQGGE